MLLWQYSTFTWYGLHKNVCMNHSACIFWKIKKNYGKPQEHDQRDSWVKLPNFIIHPVRKFKFRYIQILFYDARFYVVACMVEGKEKNSTPHWIHSLINICSLSDCFPYFFFPSVKEYHYVHKSGRAGFGNGSLAPWRAGFPLLSLFNNRRPPPTSRLWKILRCQVESPFFLRCLLEFQAPVINHNTLGSNYWLSAV